LDLLGITGVFKKGDLFKFNQRGLDLFQYISGSIGLIATDPVKMYEYDFHNTPEKIEYFVYDIIVSGQLFMEMPEDFLKRITQDDEKDIERVE
jgi:hypothetical protein